MNINFNEKFYDNFTVEELKYLVSISSAYGEGVICISLNNCFIEISADLSYDLNIYCDNHSNKTGKNISKEELFNVCNSSESLETVSFTINE